MPCKAVHVATGVAVGISVFLTLDDPQKKNNKIAEFGLLTIAGGIGGRLPDILEPANSPNHRAFFHSWSTLVATASILNKLYKWHPNTPTQEQCRKILLALGSGYASHLLLDSLTKKSLPII